MRIRLDSRGGCGLGCSAVHPWAGIGPRAPTEGIAHLPSILPVPLGHTQTPGGGARPSQVLPQIPHLVVVVGGGRAKEQTQIGFDGPEPTDSQIRLSL